MYRSYSADDDFQQVKRLIADGLSDYEISRRLEMPRPTVQRWRHRDIAPLRRVDPECHARSLTRDARAYAYLLGAYLGDGVIWRTGKASWRLAITCDSKYPGIVDEVARAVSACAPGSPACVSPKGVGALVVSASSSLWPVAFPQHGRGSKHSRSIALETWQEEITSDHPKPFIRGLIHSDGSRVVNRFRMRLRSGERRRYEYLRYFFTNSSADIRGIFCRHCDLLGIRWTRSNATNVSISHRGSVAILDSFVGPKR